MKDDEILKESNFNRLKEKIKKANLERKKVVFSSEDDDFNRKVLEKLDVEGIIVSLRERKDFMKQRNSGFNEVMGKIAKKRGIFVGIDFSEIEGKEKEIVLSRLKQNIEICNRLKIPMKLFNYGDKDEKSLKSFFIVLGMSTWMTKSLF